MCELMTVLVRLLTYTCKYRRGPVRVNLGVRVKALKEKNNLEVHEDLRIAYFFIQNLKSEQYLFG